MKIIRSFFDLSRAERRASVILLFAILLMQVLPFLFRPHPPDATDFSLLQQIAADSGNKHSSIRFVKTDNQQSVGILNAFDPNTAGMKELLALGFKPFLAKRLLKFRESGAVFRKPEDLYGLYGIDSGFVRSLMPYIRIDKIGNAVKLHQKTGEQKLVKSLTELNSADTVQLIALPGIGSKLAKRIILFREKLGGFYSVDQLKEVYGLNPEFLISIKKAVYVDVNLLRKIDINSDAKHVIASHPYIGYKNAEVIINYRKQHGPFKNPDELSKTLLFSDEVLLKLKNYIKCD